MTARIPGPACGAIFGLNRGLRHRCTARSCHWRPRRTARTASLSRGREFADAELLAILIAQVAQENRALQAGEKIAARFNDRVHRLADAGRGELKDITAAVGATAYCQIMAGIELGRRVAMSLTGNNDRLTRITNSLGALGFCRDQFARLAFDAVQEEFHVVTLDVQFHVVGTHSISVGTLDRTLVHPARYSVPQIKDAAKAIILMHNHPSGDPTPSAKKTFGDRKRLEEVRARRLGNSRARPYRGCSVGRIEHSRIPGGKSPAMNGSTFKDIEKLDADLWSAADNLRANSKLTSSDYFLPVLGIIFLMRHAANRYEAASKYRSRRIKKRAGCSSRKIVDADFKYPPATRNSRCPRQRRATTGS